MYRISFSADWARVVTDRVLTCWSKSLFRLANKDSICDCKAYVKDLLSIPGVIEVELRGKAIWIVKAPAFEWCEIRSQIRAVLWMFFGEEDQSGVLPREALLLSQLKEEVDRLFSHSAPSQYGQAD